jgi:hypothetical protein
MLFVVIRVCYHFVLYDGAPKMYSQLVTPLNIRPFNVPFSVIQRPLYQLLHLLVHKSLCKVWYEYFLWSKQNAEDNEYPSGVAPSLEFLITTKDITGSGASSTLLILNNEIGFSTSNIESICRIGRSTEKGNRHQGYIGEKGKF